MKKLMTEWRKFLKEGITDVVWHKTEEWKFLDILKDNRFMMSGGFTKDSEEKYAKNKLYYFSTARTPSSAYFPGKHMNGVVIKLDGRKLGEKHKGHAMDYYAMNYGGGPQSSKRASRLGRTSVGVAPDESFEAEDRVLSDKPFIDNADEYMLEVHMAVPVYRPSTTNFKTGEYKVVPETQINPAVYHRLKQMTAMLKERGIPTYLHITPDTWKNVAISKSKALTDWPEVEQAVEKAGITVGEKPDDGNFQGTIIGQAEIETFVELASQILAGNKELDKAGFKGNIGYHKERDRYYRADSQWRHLRDRGEHGAEFVAQELENPLHNIGADPAGRETLEKLASLMRQTKKKTIKDFINYLQSVLKSNTSGDNK